MRMFLPLVLAAVLPSGPLSAAPTGTHPHVPGDLAKDRLQDFTDLLGATDRVLLVRPDQSRAVLSEAQAKVVMSLTRDLILDDALYTDDPSYPQSRGTETVTLEEGGAPRLTLCIDRHQPTLSVYHLYGGRSVTANYLPVLPKVLRLLRSLDPSDRSLESFRPSSPPVPVVTGIPASALARIATLKPGMTRADVLYMFTTEGGLFQTYWNHYVYQDYGLTTVGRRSGLTSVSGALIKVNIDFAPRDADIVWLNGRGFWLHQSDYQKHPAPTSFDGRPDDTILRVSPPYLEHEIAN